MGPDERLTVIRASYQAFSRGDLEGDRNFVVGSARGRGRLSGVEVDLPPLAQIIDFRDGLLLRVDNHSDVEAGRKAAGLS